MVFQITKPTRREIEDKSYPIYDISQPSCNSGESHENENDI